MYFSNFVVQPGRFVSSNVTVCPVAMCDVNVMCFMCEEHLSASEIVLKPLVLPIG